MKSIFSRKEEPVELVKFINRFANEAKKERAYKRKFWSLAKQLAEYEALREIKVKSDYFDLSKFEDFLHFLKSKRPYKSSTLKSVKARLYTVIKRAKADGYKVELSFGETRMQTDESSSVFLTPEEIERIYNLSLPIESRPIRDRFIVGCCTGLRYGDYSRITTEDIQNGMLRIRTKKTGAKVILPVHWMIDEIITRNNGRLPEVKTSQQNFNKVIKTVCKKAKINDPVIIERTEGHIVVKRKVKKYEMVASHTARRSFATNLYLTGIPAAKIMLCTGHTTEGAFFKYIRINKEQNANELQENEYFKKQP